MLTFKEIRQLEPQIGAANLPVLKRARGRPRTNPDVRFFSHVRVDENRCWLWQGEVDWKGLPVLWDGYKHVRAYRYSFSRFVGDIPAGLDVLRKCHNKLCVNPVHLATGIHDKLARARQQLAKTYCPQGHPYDEANTYRYINANGNPARNCRACMRERERQKQIK